MTFENERLTDNATPPVKCPDCGRDPCACELIERANLAEANASKATSEAYRYRLLWECAASCLATNAKKIKPRGADERRMLEKANDAANGTFWSGLTDGWIA